MDAKFGNLGFFGVYKSFQEISGQLFTFGLHNKNCYHNSKLRINYAHTSGNQRSILSAGMDSPVPDNYTPLFRFIALNRDSRKLLLAYVCI